MFLYKIVSGYYAHPDIHDYFTDKQKLLDHLSSNKDIVFENYYDIYINDHIKRVEIDICDLEPINENYFIYHFSKDKFIQKYPANNISRGLRNSFNNLYYWPSLYVNGEHIKEVLQLELHNDDVSCLDDKAMTAYKFIIDNNLWRRTDIIDLL